MESISKKSIDSLITFHSKFRLLINTKFIKHFQFQKGLNLHQVFYPQLKSGKISLNEPSEEIIDAFLLHFRQFHLARDVTSIKYLKNYILPELPNEFSIEKKKIELYIKKFEESLKNKPFIELNLTVNNKKFDLNTNIDYINTMIYGGKIHSSPDSTERLYYDYFHKNSKEGFKPITKRLFRFNVYSIILEEIHVLGLLYNEVNTILIKLIDFFRKRGKELIKKSNLKSSLRYFKNAIYIADQLEFQYLKAEILEDLLIIHKKLKNQEKVKKIKEQVNVIKDSITEIPSNFYNDPFFKDFFRTPIEFEELFNKVLPNIDLNDKPIIILTLNRINDVKKFDKHLNMKYFSYEIEHKKLIINYSIAIGKNKDLIYYFDKKEEINLDHKFGLTFVYPDLSCFIILTNDPKMALLDYIYTRGASSLDPLFHLYLNKFSEFIIALIKVELNKSTKKPRFRSKEDIFKGTLEFDEMARDATFIKRILRRIFQISYFPRILSKVDLESEIKNLRRMIENDFEKELKGQALFSFALSIYLYTILTNDKTFLEKRTEFNKLFKVLEFINGKNITCNFLNTLLKHLDQNYHFYIQKKNIGKKGFKFQK